MSGRAIILIVSGIIVISAIILHSIEAASTKIVENSTGYFLRQSARNLAQSGVNLSLRQLGKDHAWRSGYNSLKMLGGTVSVRVFDTTYAGLSTAIGIQSTGTVQDTTAVSTAYCYLPDGFFPTGMKGLLTLNGPNQVNGNITIDS